MDENIYNKEYNNYEDSDYIENYTKINNKYNTYFIEFLFFSFIFGSMGYNIYTICCKNYKKYKSSKRLNEILLSNDSDNECSICLDKFLKKEKIIQLDCNHIFHKKCIMEWFSKNENNSCPLCRRNNI